MGGETELKRVPLKRYTSTDKERLTQLLYEERAEKRCDIVHKLNEERDALVKEIDLEIYELDAKISKLNSDKLSLKMKKENMLKTKHLLHFEISRGTCTINDIHPTLRNFDIETRDLERKILELPVR